jgi:Kdo2-lipid IVA lauroyltransferase/acyltransferase
MAPPLKKRLKRQTRSVLVRGLVAIVSLLPLRPALRLGGALGALAFRVAGKTRRLALDHLAIAFPEKTAAEREAIARAMFVHLGRSALEFTSIRSYDADLERYVALEQPAVLPEAMARGKGLVFVTGHLGNWELLARRIARAGVPNAAVAKAGGDSRLNRLAEHLRAEGGVTTLWREDPGTGRAIIRTFRQNRALGLLIDQDTNVQGVFAPFFGRPAYTPRSAADLALRFGAPVVVATIHRRGPDPLDGHVVELTPIPYDPNPVDEEAEVIRLTAACNAVLEDAIRRFPAEWVWMHARWKRQPPGGLRQPPEGSAPEASSMPKRSALSRR